MKDKEAMEENIMPKGDAPLFEWLQSMQFKSKMILAVDEGLKKIKFAHLHTSHGVQGADHPW